MNIKRRICRIEHILFFIEVLLAYAQETYEIHINSHENFIRDEAL